MTDLISQDWHAIEDVLNRVSETSGDPLYTESEAAKESLLRIASAAKDARLVTAMLLTKYEVGLLIDAVGGMVDRTHREGSPLLLRLQGEYTRLRVIERGEDV